MKEWKLSIFNIVDKRIKFYSQNTNLLGSAVAWWLMPRNPFPEVGGSSPTRVKPCCVLE